MASAAPETKTPTGKAGNRSFMSYNLFVRHGAASATSAQYETMNAAAIG
jgi:hypothetical protein